MRREPLPRSLVFSVIAAVCALGMALAALGGWGGGLPDALSASGGSPLSPLPTWAPDRLGSQSDYPDTIERPLFHSDRRPHAYSVGGQSSAAASQWRLSGVLITPTLQMATLSDHEGRSLRLTLDGPVVDGWQLLGLAPRSASVNGPAGRLELDLDPHVATVETSAPAAFPAAAAQTGAGADGSEVAAPSREQIDAIRQRIQARRLEMQKNNNDPNMGQK